MLLAVLLAVAQPGMTSSAEFNVAHALTTVCFPYVLEGAPAERVLAKRPGVMDDHFRSPALERLGNRPVRVGFAGFPHVSVGVANGNRTCSLTAQNADPQKLRSAALGVLRARPEKFAPTASRYLPGGFATEDRMCTAASSPKPNAVFLLSSAHEGDRARPALILTLWEGSKREAVCDRDDVHADYRTLIPPGQPDPSAPAPR